MDSQLTDTLKAILSDPESMKSIMKIAQNLGAQGEKDATTNNSVTTDNDSFDENVSTNDISDGAHNTESTADTVLPERKEAPSERKDSAQDNRVKLLLALRPFLDPTRQQKADSLIKALGAAQVLYQLGGNDLFKNFGL